VKIKLGVVVFALTTVLSAGLTQAGATPVAGTGISVNPLGAWRVPGGVRVSFNVRCGTYQDEKREVAGETDSTTPDTYILVFNFNLTQGSVTGSGGNNGTYPSITCNQTPQNYKFTVPGRFVAGAAQLTNVNAAALDSDNSCGTVVVNGQTYPNPCDGNYPGFSQAINIR
jgi:hypothetical protein